jgi:integrase
MKRRRFGQVRKLPSGRWQASAPLQGGGHINAPATFKTKTAADQWLGQFETDRNRGKWVDHRLGRGTVEDWAQRWFSSTSHLKPKTRAGYESLIGSRIVPALGTVPLGELRPITVQEWVAGMTANGLSPSRVRQAFGVLRQMLDAAERNGMIGANPCRGISLPRLPEPEPVILTPAQVANLAAAAAPPYGLMVRLLAYGGMRIGECIALRRSCVDEVGRRLVIRESVTEVNGKPVWGPTKTHATRNVALPASLFDALTAHLAENVPAAPNALIFPDSTGGTLHYSNFLRRVWKPAAKAAGLADVTPKGLRSSCASWIVDSGGSIMDAGAQLGHAKSTVTTRHYARAITGRDTVLAERLDEQLQAAEKAMIVSDAARGLHDGIERRLRAAPK